MRFGFLIILGFFCRNHSKAQTLPSGSSVTTGKDSVSHLVRLSSSNYLLPPEFTSPALENEYYAESDSIHGLYVFVLKLRSNCTFFYETYCQQDNMARVQFYIGTYTVSRYKIHLTYTALLPKRPDKRVMPPITLVSWSLPDRLKYLKIKKDILFEPNRKRIKIDTDKKSERKRIVYTLKVKSQFDLRSCK